MLSTTLSELEGRVHCFYPPRTCVCAAQVGVIDELKRKWYTQLAECPAGPVSLCCPSCSTCQATYTNTSTIT